jgi:hypothetical protein
MPQGITLEHSLLVICGSIASKGGTAMKIHHSRLIGLVAAFAVALASVAVNAVAAETPFKGAFTAVETSQLVFPILSVNREGTGTATYLGKYTEHATFQVDVRTGSATGAATFTAANGDTLTASVVGQGTPTGPTTRSIVEVYTITGGTGRFADATGTLTLERTLDLTTGVSTGTFSGAIEH